PFELALAFLMIDHVDRHLAVELVRQVIAAGDNGVFVPLGDVGFHGLGLLDEPARAVTIDNDRLAILSNDAATAFVVEHGVVALIGMNVALIAADRPRADVFQLLAAILNSRIV